MNELLRKILPSFLLITCFFFAFSSVLAQSPYYYYFRGEKQGLDLNTRYAYVKFDGSVEAVEDLPVEYRDLCDFGVLYEEKMYGRLHIAEELRGDVPQERFSLLVFKEVYGEAEYWERLEWLGELEGVVAVSPYFKTEGCDRVGMANTFVVKLHKAEDLAILEEISTLHNIKQIGQNKFMPLWYTLAVTKESAFNAMEAANYFYETGLFWKTEPEFLGVGEVSRHKALDGLGSLEGGLVEKPTLHNSSQIGQNELMPSLGEFLEENPTLHNNSQIGQNELMPSLGEFLEENPTLHNNVQIGQNELMPSLGEFLEENPTLHNNVQIGQSALMPLWVNSNDPYYDELWAHENTGQYVKDFGNGVAGIDMNVPEAWTTTKGDGVNVGVVDQGALLTHEDLDGQFLNDGFDAIGGSSPQVLYAYHGMTVTGIVAATADNGKGVAGVAPMSKIIPVSHSLWLSDPVQSYADAVNWAWQNGADVMSNSWNHNDLTSSMIEEALNDAIQYGRNGLGTVVVQSAGNNNGVATFPSNSVADLLVVGAMNPDGTRWSNSNYGTHVDVFAPGVGVRTTSYTGDQDYEYFGATSCATPHVSGVAALILSANPCLSGQEVRDVIEATAQKVGGYSYTTVAGRENGTWSNQLAYGLVGAEAAVQLAVSLQNGDSDGDGVCNMEDICEGFDDTVDSDVDNIPDGCDICPNSTFNVDADNDGVCDDIDICLGFDDTIDSDTDGVPDGCDICGGFDDNLDSDVDNVPDGCDICPNSTFNVDADNDGVCDDIDICLGFDDNLDADVDGIPDGCDICGGSDDNLDSDVDGVPDGCDICIGFDDTIDSDVDNVPDGCDICPNSTFNVDADNDGVCDDIDICLGFDNNLIGMLCNDGDTCTVNDAFDASCNCVGIYSDTDNDGVCNVLDVCPLEWGNTIEGCPAASVEMRVFLQGALENSGNDTLMRNDLYTKGYLPLTESYSSNTAFTHYGSGGGETTTDSILNTYEIVDWLLVELRDSTDSTNIIATKAVLLQKDGHIIDHLGNSALIFDSIPIASYYISVKHRNHLGIMTNQAYYLDGNTNPIDFTNINTAMWGNEACITMSNNRYAMWAGNVNADGTIIFQGINNDPNSVFFAVLSSLNNGTGTPNYVEEGYFSEDANLDGKVIYQGLNNEINQVFFNVLSSPDNPTGLSNYIMKEQMP